MLSKHEVMTEVWGSGNEPAVDHVELAAASDLLLVAPATAHTLGKFAQGLADDFLSTYFLAHRGPVLVAPAMESAMWAHPAVRRNMELLTARGVRAVGPETGPLASGRSGLGRMAEPEAIVAEAWSLATGARRGPLGPEAPRDGGTDARANRSDPLRLEPLERENGLRPRRSGA